MTIYPEVNTAILDIIFQFYGKGSVSMTVGKLGTLHLERRNMMSNNNLCYLNRLQKPHEISLILPFYFIN